MPVQLSLPLWLSGEPLHCSAYGMHGCQAAEVPEFKCMNYISGTVQRCRL